MAQFALAVRNATATARRDAIDAAATPGVVRLYTGSMPADADTAVGGQTLLGTVTCAQPCGSVADGKLTFSSLTQDDSADASGTAAWARIEDGDGNAVVDLTVSATGGGGELQLNTTSIVAGGPIQIDALEISEG